MHQLRGSQAEQRDPLSPAGAPPKPYARIFFWCVVLVLGLLRAWAHRNDVSPDSISYIEIAWATACGGLHQIVNGTWRIAGSRLSGESGDVSLVLISLFSAFCLCRIAGGSFRAAAFRTLLAAGVFAGFALPLVLSAAKGRPTFGDAGRINYAEFVNRAARSEHWQGGPPGTGTPPDVFEF